MRKSVLTFGLITGAVLSVMTFITLAFEHRIGVDKGAIVGYTTMVLAVPMVYFGVRSYRDTVAGGGVTFGRACTVGFLITQVATVCYVASWELIYYKFTPDLADKYAAYVIDKAKQSGATEEQIAAQAKRMAGFKAMYRNPLVNIAYAALEPLPVGIVFTLVTAGMLSRTRGPGDTEVA